MSVSTLAKPTRRSGRHHAGDIVYLELDRVVARSNCRQTWTEEDDAFVRLLKSVEAHEQDVPAICYYDLEAAVNVVVDGHRRYRCCQILRRPLKAIVLDHMPTEEEILALQLRTFTHRADINQLDKARALKRSMELNAFSQRQLAEHHGESEATVSKLLSLLELPESAQEEVRRGASVERTLAKYSSKKRRRQHGKKRTVRGLGRGRTVLLTARVEVDDAVAIEMLEQALAKLRAGDEDSDDSDTDLEVDASWRPTSAVA